MKKFMDRDFLLSTETARRLYHEAAALQPIFDYHCHLSPKEIAENRRYNNLAEVWLGGDHYKWRAMRANGVDERLITGDADPYDKFLAWAETVPRLPGNPLYHWTHLELQRYFDIHTPLDAGSAPEIWREANDILENAAEFSPLRILRKFNVYAVGTTDDPVDSLEYHESIAKEANKEAAIATKVLPSFRPDKALEIAEPGFAAYTAELGRIAGKPVNSLKSMLAALAARIDYFDEHGCLASDHALEYAPFEAASNGSTEADWEKETAAVFDKVMSGDNVNPREVELYKTYTLCFLAGEYKKHGWAMQLHLSALRSINSDALKRLGPNTGFDVLHDHPVAAKLARLLNEMNRRGGLPKTILYSLNPKDYYPLATIMGSFQSEIPGKMQFGSAWWFLDSRDGMEFQIRTLANVGLLSRFVGMLTDSRSFLSYPRHEYFRRILCNLVGGWVESGEFPYDWEFLSGLVNDISFGNAKTYFEGGNGL
ncbi:MAG: glucuronate isomerase [Spirochaetaceae bacterium]|jgi:glucuronate isomerase|nr:glucuronate isomerase [Spirochaetaceae bacterium]